jgi:spore germination cell wall hydrolase CwlJ-like protein
MKQVISLLTVVFLSGVMEVRSCDTMTVGANPDTQAEILIVALTLLGEARGEGEVGMKSVAQVVHNRAVTRKLTPAQVCLQPKQFSFWNNSTDLFSKRSLLYTKEGQIAWDIASRVVEGIEPMPTLGAVNHYHTVSISPSWSKGRSGIVIGNHIFFKI